MTLDEARQIVRDRSKYLVDKWSKTSLLDGVNNDIEKSNMSVLIESQPRHILVSEMTDEEKKLDEAYRVLAANIKL